jgi:hypothetical protein
MSGQEFEDAVRDVLARSNDRRKETVRGLISILTQMATNGVKVFTVAAVGRECEAARIVKTQTIRNASGSDFRLLIEAFARSRGVSTTHSPAIRVSPMEAAIAAIPDLEIRARLRAIIADNNACKADNARLRAAFSRLQAPPAPPITEPWEQSAMPEVEVLPPAAPLSLGPLERFVSPEWIDALAWTISETGTIMDGGRALTPPGFVLALKGVIDYVHSARGRVRKAG